MPINTVCPECGCKIRASEESAAKKIRCPKCDARVVVGESEDAERNDGKHAIQAERPRERSAPTASSAAHRRDDNDDEKSGRRKRRRDRDDDDDYDDDDVLTTLIPTSNPKALAAYYLGVFSLIPILGLILGPLALIFGIKGKRYANANPKAKGWGHAIAGIVLGSFTTLLNVIPIIMTIIGIATVVSKNKKSENPDVKDRIAEIVKRSQEGGHPKAPPVNPPIQPKAEAAAGKGIAMRPVERLFSTNRDFVDPGRDVATEAEEGLVAAVRVSDQQVFQVVFSPDGKYLAIETPEGYQLIETATSRMLPRWIVGRGPLAFSRDGKMLAAVRFDGGSKSLDLLNPSTGEPTRSLLPNVTCDGVDFSHDSTSLVAVLAEGPKRTLMHWKIGVLPEKPSILLQSVGTTISSPAFAPNGHTLAVASEEEKGTGIRLLDTRTGTTKTLSQKQDLIPRIYSLTFSPDGKLLASGGTGNPVAVWDLEKGQVKATPPNHRAGCAKVLFSRDGSLLATRGFEGNFVLWETKSFKELATRSREEPNTAGAMAFSPDGKLLVTGSHGLLKAWEVAKLAGR
jgi:WD40 repeat protein